MVLVPGWRRDRERNPVVVVGGQPDVEVGATLVRDAMPAYAKNGKMVCCFQTRQTFNTRYATLGFNDTANPDDGTIWPTYCVLTKLTAADETRIAALVKMAVS